MKIAFFSSEVYPFVKTGGLAEVSNALPKALSERGNEVRIFTPKYKVGNYENVELMNCSAPEKLTVSLGADFEEARFYKTFLPHSSVEVILVENEKFFGRESVYTEDADEGERFVFFSKASLEFISRSDWKPSLLHVNDWQTALIPYYAKNKYEKLGNVPSLLTLHNVGYQGIFGKELLEKASIEGKYFFPMGPAEYYGKVNFLKMGIFFADKLNTVSPTYAKEILQPEYGAGMEGVLREREKDLSGILNGVDYSEWNPATDKFIYKNYDENSLENKIVNKEYLLKEFKLNAEEDVPLIGMVSRLVHQKGFDLFTEALPRLMSLNAHWILLGSGWKEFEEKILSFSQKYSDKFKVVIGYDNKLAHRIEAAADIFLMPSRYEPCGLNQIYSLKYGTLPLVRRTGGLADTVKDFRLENPYLLKIANGFTFDEYSVNALYRAVERALKIYEEKDIWKRLQLNGMAEDFSWATAAGKYEKLYREMISG